LPIAERKRGALPSSAAPLYRRLHRLDVGERADPTQGKIVTRRARMAETLD
jgi:hypothetical protein